MPRGDKGNYTEKQKHKAEHIEEGYVDRDVGKKGSATTRKKLAHQICVDLKVHTVIKEKISYPAFRGKIEDDMLDEARVEHDGAKILVNDIEAGAPGDDFYDARLKILSEEIKHHAHEEEMPSEGMFAQCRKADVDLATLRDAMLARKQELMAQEEKKGLPPAVPHALRLQPA